MSLLEPPRPDLGPVPASQPITVGRVWVEYSAWMILDPRLPWILEVEGSLQAHYGQRVSGEDVPQAKPGHYRPKMGKGILPPGTTEKGAIVDINKARQILILKSSLNFLIPS